jgi:thiol-disulfide isomerase/thioredoxin
MLLSSTFSSVAQSRVKRKTGARTKTVAPVVKTIDLDGLQLLLKRENSRPLVLNFWATWCDPCREEFPDLVKIDRDYRPRGLDFIAISLDDLKDIKTEVPKFLRGMKATMPAYLLNVSDPEPAIKAVDPNWSGALPATVLYNQKGEIVFKHFGRVKPEELRSAIDKLIGGE